MSFRPIKKKLMGQSGLIVSCPTCHKQHKWSGTGDYCSMTCYYAKPNSNDS